MKNKSAIYSLILLISFSFSIISCSTSNVYAPVGSNRHSVKPSATSHIVQSRDTLYSIAWQIGRDYKELARWNGISHPYTIYKGQKITLVPAKISRKKAAKKVFSNKKTVKKQRIAATTSNNYQKELKLSWQWPIQVRRLEKGVVKTGVTLVGTAGELVRSSESGKIVYAGNGLKGYGNLLIVKHRDEFLTAYGYNKRLLVKEGSVVKKGQAIAEIGKDNKNRPALFFEIRRRGKAVSVTEYLPKKGR
ncbi:MAG: peptidoglycan DD-metalloendopeptidase family protein [Cycloclasticus sp.]